MNLEMNQFTLNTKVCIIYTAIFDKFWVTAPRSCTLIVKSLSSYSESGDSFTPNEQAHEIMVLRAAREISFVLIVLPSWNKVFIIIIIIIITYHLAWAFAVCTHEVWK